MKLKKFTKIILILFVISILCSIYLVVSNYINKGIFDLEEYNELEYSKIKSIDVIEDKNNKLITNTYTDKNDIKKIYNKLDKKTLGKNVKEKECNNYIIYMIHTKKDSFKVELECDILKVGNERYILK